MTGRRRNCSMGVFCAIVAGLGRGQGAAATGFAPHSQRVIISQYRCSGRLKVIHASSEPFAAQNIVEVQLPGLRISENQDPFLCRALSCRGGDETSLRLSTYFVGSKSRCWAILFLAILIDSCTITMMKVAQDEGSAGKLVISYFGYFLSMFGFALSLNSLDVSIAYAVWAALGTAIVSTVGILKFKEDFDGAKLGCLSMIVLGVVGLNLRGS